MNTVGIFNVKLIFRPFISFPFRRVSPIGKAYPPVRSSIPKSVTPILGAMYLLVPSTPAKK